MATTAPAVPSGPAHVAVVSFLAARAAPTGGFWIALAGGVALARVAQRRGARLGFGASIAAMLETVAIIGPARFGIPLTQAVTAPMLGRLEARGWAAALADARLRRAAPAAQHRHHGVLHLGDRRRPRRLRRHLRRDRPPARPRGRQRGRAGAHRGRPARLGGLRDRSCRCSSTGADCALGRPRPTDADLRGVDRESRAHRSRVRERRRRFDPRLLALAALAAFVALLASTSWWLLATVALLLALAWLHRRHRTASPSPRGCCSPRSSPAARSSSGSAAGSASTWRCGARAGPRCWCSWPPGCAGPPARRACARWRGGVLGRLRRLPVAAGGGGGARRDRLRGPAWPRRDAVLWTGSRACPCGRCRCSTPCSVGGGRVGRGQAGTRALTSRL